MDGPVPRPLADVLGDLVRLAEQLLERPYVVIGKAAEIDALDAEVKAWIRRPAEGARIIDERAAWLITALRAVVGAGATHRTRGAWHDLAVVLAEHATEMLAAALDAAERPTP